MIAVPPLLVLEFLHRTCDIFEDYFGDCSETTLKEHYVIVFEVCTYIYIYIYKTGLICVESLLVY